MTVHSMTGYGRAEGAFGDRNWVWELRSVNGKGLDLKFRMPSGFDGLELKCRKYAQAHLSRGNVQIGLTLRMAEQGARLQINDDALQQALDFVRVVQSRMDVELSRASDVLALPGVVERVTEELDEAGKSALATALFDGFVDAVEAQLTARKDEGGHLANVIAGLLEQIETLVAEARANPARDIDAIKARLARQVSLLSETELDADRLYQEAALIASKADIQEELDRLDGHVAAARNLLTTEGPVGRKFDFLTQEFNREANTLCSKSNDSALTRTGLALKAVVDQLREQVQNVE